MLILSVLLAVIVGWLMGGRLSGDGGTEIRFLWLPAASAVLQRLYLRPWTLILSYLLLFVFLWFNRQARVSAALLGAGSLCNLIVIMANGFRMPVAAAALSLLPADRAQALLSGKIPMYCAVGEDTRLPFLGDILAVNLPVVGGFASIGDVLLALGIFGFVMAVMAPPRLSGLWTRGRHQA
ncbi:MAG: DUF5317 domain-containing protein [Clostridiaceae bacterium]|nr:DUF5317 domain-containing protein [Clostridiaceae bacterium]